MSRLAKILSGLASVQRESGAKKLAIETDALAVRASGCDLPRVIDQIDLVEYFVAKLRAAGEDFSRAEPLLKRMGSPGVLNKIEASSIAAQFVGGRTSYRTKALALEAIRDRISRDAGFTSKSRVS